MFSLTTGSQDGTVVNISLPLGMPEGVSVSYNGTTYVGGDTIHIPKIDTAQALQVWTASSGLVATSDDVGTYVIAVRRVSCVKEMWHEDFLHENETSIHEMKFTCMKMKILFLWVKISCMKLCIAQLPMIISGAKKSCEGQNNHFQAWKLHFHA